MFSVITHIYKKKTNGPTLMELFTVTGKLKKLFDNYSCSMCAPRMTRHISIRYSRSCHTHVNMGASIFFTAAMIRAFRSAWSRGNFVTNTRSSTYPQRKNTCKCVSYGFPIINCCNPGIHYETPCIYFFINRLTKRI